MKKQILIIKQVENEGPGSIAEFFRNNAYGLITVELAKNEPFPDMPQDFAAIIIMGGPMNVYQEDKYPFLREEDIFIKEILGKEIPFLGICLGAQLLAKACGAKVKKAEQEEIGWSKVRLTNEGVQDVLFKGVHQELDVFQWHEDTFNIPEQGILLAISTPCKNQAFRFGKNAYGFQFHIEVTPYMVELWIKEYIKSDNPSQKSDVKNIIVDTYMKKKKFTKQTNDMLTNFLHIIEGGNS